MPEGCKDIGLRKWQDQEKALKAVQKNNRTQKAEMSDPCFISFSAS